MLKRIISGTMLTLLLANILTLAFNIQLVNASETIYIRADGSIEPASANVTTLDNVTYTFTNNNYGSIIVERSNIIIDGNGYALQGLEVVDFGFGLDSLSNVTIQNMSITGFGIGIFLSWSNNNSIWGNNITNNGNGIYLSDSDENEISGNTITNHTRSAVYLSTASDKNSIIRNTITNSIYGINLDTSDSNTISENDITDSDFGIFIRYYYKIMLPTAINNKVIGNTITNSKYDGIRLDRSNNNFMSMNTITNNNRSGIFIDRSLHTSVFSNYITNNGAGVFLNSISTGFASIFYHNNFINNEQQAYIPDLLYNIWDNGYPLGGNYWSDYTGTDFYSGPNQNEIGSDNIGDTPYNIVANVTDRYPLVKPWTPTRTTETKITLEGTEHLIEIETNATLTHVKATAVKLCLMSHGTTGQKYYINTTFPKINQTEIKVFIDGEQAVLPPFPIITANDTHYFIYFEITASIHEITLQYATTNIATTNLRLSRTTIIAGHTVRIYVTVENQGIYTETFNVTAYANTTIIGIHTNITLAPRDSTLITFTWNTTGLVEYQSYIIRANATLIPNEIDQGDNTRIDGTITITHMGDINADGKVDIYDVSVVSGAFGTINIDDEYWHPTPCPYCPHNPNADVNNDGKIDIQDLARSSSKFGWFKPP